MASIWIVQNGYYSDRNIIGVFTEKAKAEALASLFADADWDEWELDPDVPTFSSRLRPWNILMFMNGNTRDCFQLDVVKMDWSTDHPKVKLTDDVTMLEAVIPRRRPSKSHIRGTVWAESEEHAVKIANEFRTRWLAEHTE